MAEKPTTERLAEALSLAGASKEMITRALSGYYDDYKSPLAFPTSQLVADARAAGLADIVRAVMAGEFDATKEEADEWAASPDGQETFAALLRAGEEEGA